MRIEPDDPERPDVYALLDEHLRSMHALSPPESVHALDVSGLKQPAISFWSVRDGDTLLGCGALREPGPAHGEVKSMRTPAGLCAWPDSRFGPSSVQRATRHTGARA